MLQPGDPLEGPSSSRCCSTLRYIDSTSTSAVLSSMKRRSRASIWDRSPERPSTRKRSGVPRASRVHTATRSEEHTSELQSRSDLVCRLLLEKKKKNVLSSTYRADTLLISV